MNVDPDDFRRHYSALSEEALLDLNPEDLTDVARQCYEVELSHRGLKRPLQPKLAEPEPGEPQSIYTGPRFSTEHLAWRSTAVPVVEFEYAEEAEQARDVLEQASIPCALVGEQQDPSLGYTRKYGGKQIALVVPRSFLETARQRLRTEIEEPSADEGYAKHFVEFSDDELLDVDVQTLPENAQKWYRAEIEHRGLEQEMRNGISNLPSKVVAPADGFMAVATLLEGEADAAIRFLERESIPCHVERDSAQGGFENFAILVPSSYLDRASEILIQHQGEIFKNEPTD